MAGHDAGQDRRPKAARIAARLLFDSFTARTSAYTPPSDKHRAMINDAMHGQSHPVRGCSVTVVSRGVDYDACSGTRHKQRLTKAMQVDECVQCAGRIRTNPYEPLTDCVSHQSTMTRLPLPTSRELAGRLVNRSSVRLVTMFLLPNVGEHHEMVLDGLSYRQSLVLFRAWQVFGFATS